MVVGTVTGRRFAFSVKFVAGKQRHMLDRLPARMYTPSGTLRAELEVAAACEDAMGAAGIKAPAFGPHEPVIVTIDVYRPLPDGRPRCVRSEPDTYKPDADNVAKLVMDALTGVAWADDSQVVDLHVRKHPRVRGQAERMDITVAPGWSGRGNETEVG
nr:MAG TPA: Endodeoxyribonuclease RusA [Caudoviricetes sp.]